MTTDTNPNPIGLPPTEESPMSNAPGPGAWADNFARDRTQDLAPASKRTTDRNLGVSRHGLDDELGLDLGASAVDYLEGQQ